MGRRIKALKKILVIIMTVLMCMLPAACANDASEGEEAGRNIGNFTSADMDANEVTEAI